VANGGHVQNANGYDIYFYSDAALTTRLPTERESYNATTGAYIGWVNVATLSHTADTIIYIAYGDSGISSDPNTDGTYGATHVWDANYRAVWHLNEATNATNLDSTANAVSCTPHNSPAQGAGQINGGLTFDGVSKYSTAGNNLGFERTDPLSISFWMKAPAIGVDCNVISKQDSNSPWYGYAIDFAYTANKIRFLEYAGASALICSFPASYTDNTWHHVAVTYLGNRYASGLTFYVDGASVAVSTTTEPISNNIAGVVDFQLSGRLGANSCAPVSLDEVRVSDSVRAPSWVLSEFNNQSSPSTFYALGAETAVASGGYLTKNYWWQQTYGTTGDSI
jgi:hypothetical protein